MEARKFTKYQIKKLAELGYEYDGGDCISFLLDRIKKDDITVVYLYYLPRTSDGQGNILTNVWKCMVDILFETYESYDTNPIDAVFTMFLRCHKKGLTINE